jgi:hypothetical protein
MFYKNNWLAWTYDDGPEYGPKLSPQAEMKFILRNTITRPVKSYYEELLENGRAIYERFNEPLSLLFSGGVDSEVVLRVYLDLKIPINVYIFKYENDYNVIEFTHAVAVCEKLNVKPIIVDFNLEKFFENEAYDFMLKTYAMGPGWLPHMKMTEYVDGIPIIGSGEPYFRRRSRDWTSKHQWIYQIDEHSHHWAVYHTVIGRKAIADWYEYSPEILVSFSKLPYIQDLINDRVYGKLSTETSKVSIHQPYWPDLQPRQKLVGFEGPVPDKEKILPPFMVEFDQQYTKNNTNKIQIYSEEDLLSLIYSQ